MHRTECDLVLQQSHWGKNWTANEVFQGTCTCTQLWNFQNFNTRRTTAVTLIFDTISPQFEDITQWKRQYRVGMKHVPPPLEKSPKPVLDRHIYTYRHIHWHAWWHVSPCIRPSVGGHGLHMCHVILMQHRGGVTAASASFTRWWKACQAESATRAHTLTDRHTQSLIVAMWHHELHAEVQEEPLSGGICVERREVERWDRREWKGSGEWEVRRGKKRDTRGVGGWGETGEKKKKKKLSLHAARQRSLVTEDC